MMKRRKRSNTIKLIFLKLTGHHVFADEFDVWIKFRALPCETNHLRRQINGENFFGARGKLSGKISRATTDFKHQTTLLWNLLQQKLVILRIVIPGFIREQSNPIKIRLD